MKNAFILLLMVSFISLTFFACSNREDETLKMLNKASALQQVGKYDEAKIIIQDIIRKYPETRIAKVLAGKEETEGSKAASATEQKPPESAPTQAIIPFNPPPAERAPAPLPQEQKTPPIRQSGLTEQDERNLDRLYDEAMSESKSGKTVGGAANCLCLAEVINAVKSKGQSINSEFWNLAEDAMGTRTRYTVGGQLNAIQRAAITQSINTSNFASCNSAMSQSVSRGRY